MRKLSLLLLTIAAFLGACGSSDDSLVGGALGPGGQALPTIGSECSTEEQCKTAWIEAHSKFVLEKWEEGSSNRLGQFVVPIY